MAVPTTLSICTGYSGIELGLSAVGDFEPVCYVENDASQAAVLAARMGEGFIPEAPVWSDLTTFDCGPWRGLVDLMVGGFPCPPFSVAGKHLGKDDPRNLWPHVARLASELGHPALFLENVDGILEYYYFTIRPELQAMGYRVAEGLYTAEETGAPHRRLRLFFMAVHGEDTSVLALPGPERLERFAWNHGVSERAVHPHLGLNGDGVRSWSGRGSGELEDTGGERCERWDRGLEQRTLQEHHGTTHQAEPSGSELGDSQSIIGERSVTVGTGTGKPEEKTGNTGDAVVEPEELGNSNSEGLQGRGECRYSAREQPPREAGTQYLPLYPPGPEDTEGWAYMLGEMPASKPSICFLVDGRPPQLERVIRSYGNGVVPAVAAIAWCDLAQTIIQEVNMIG